MLVDITSFVLFDVIPNSMWDIVVYGFKFSW